VQKYKVGTFITYRIAHSPASPPSPTTTGYGYHSPQQSQPCGDQGGNPQLVNITNPSRNRRAPAALKLAVKRSRSARPWPTTTTITCTTTSSSSCQLPATAPGGPLPYEYDDEVNDEDVERG